MTHARMMYWVGATGGFAVGALFGFIVCRVFV